MGSSHTSSGPVSAAFQQAFAARAGSSGTLSFADFMAVALYDPAVGYYRRAKARVGYAEGTDFFTASTSGPIFGELVGAACVNLLGERSAADYDFIEIGAEATGGILAGVAHPFASARTVRIGEELRLNGKCVVFSNELFDAQPFRRFIFREGRWRELGVHLEGELLRHTELPPSEYAELPINAPDGYVIDAPFAARDLARTIAAEPWIGLFVACDYGKTWQELIEATPAGTARAYSRHVQSNNLLAQPGEQDLTCHVCWDWIGEALAAEGFRDVVIETQESFLVRHAGERIAAISSEEAARLSPRKQSLMQLLHPAHLGQKFQVLHAWRG